MTGKNINRMSVDDLLSLGRSVDKVLLAKFSAERQELETRLARLQQTAGKHGLSKSSGAAVASKN
jgi:hypothetical protein